MSSKALLTILFVVVATLGCSDDETEPAEQNGKDDPFAAEMDGSGVVALWKGHDVIAALEVAPGGRKLAMAHFPPGELASNFAISSIAILDLDEPDPQIEVVFDAEGADVLPSWSPQGDRILFLSQCASHGAGSQCLTEAGDDKLPTDLFILDPVTGTVENLTNTPEQSEGDPSWASPELVLFTRPNKDTGNVDVWGHNLTNGSEKRITEPMISTDGFDPPWAPGDFDPHMNPEGTMIAFERHMDTAWSANGIAIGDFDLTVLDLTKSGAMHIPDDTSDADIRPVWAPEGWLTFARFFEDHDSRLSDVLVMKQDGSEKMNITKDLPVAGAQWPHWIPSDKAPQIDGSADLVFLSSPKLSACTHLCAKAKICGGTGQYGVDGCMQWCEQTYGDMTDVFDDCLACMTDGQNTCDELFPADGVSDGICHDSCLPPS